MKKFTIFILTLLSILPAWAVDIVAGDVFYLRPSSKWASGSTYFFAFFYINGSSVDSWINMTKVEGETNLYKCDKPDGNWTHLSIFCSNTDLNELEWDKIKQKYQDIDLSKLDGTNNCCTIDDNGVASWSVYTPPVAITAGIDLYMKPDNIWKENNSWFSACFSDSDNNQTWVRADMVTDAGVANDSIFKVTTPEGSYTKVTFVCQKDTATQPGVEYNRALYQTAALSWDGVNNLYTIADSAWSTITLSVQPTITVQGTGATIVAGEGSTIMYRMGDEGEYTLYTAPITTAGRIETYAYAQGLLNSAIVCDTIEKVNQPVITVENANVTIAADEGTTIMYRLNETGEFITYTAPFTVTHKVEAYACADGKLDSDTAIHTIPYQANITPETILFLTLASEDKEANAQLFYVARYINKNTGAKSGALGWYVAETNTVFYKSASDEVTRSNETESYTHVTFYSMSENPSNYTEEQFINGEAEITLIGDAELYYDGENNRYYEAQKKWDSAIATGIEHNSYSNGIDYVDGIVIAEGAIEVYNINGTIADSGNNEIDLNKLNRGIYIVRNGDQVRKVVVR